MQLALVVALIVAVASLWWVAIQQSKTINKYERDLLEKSNKTTVSVKRTRKNVSR